MRVSGRMRPAGGDNAAPWLRSNVALFSVLQCLLFVHSASAQGLIPVPKTVTRELGAYYISKLGLSEGGFEFYGVLAQRNIGASNAYVEVNGLDPNDSPQEAARKMATVRGSFKVKTLGGTITVDGFYRLLRCTAVTCFGNARVQVVKWDKGNPGPVYLLTLVKSPLGATPWFINARQGVVNMLSDTQAEQPYTDAVYKKFTLYHTVMKAPLVKPCSSALPVIGSGSIGEYLNKPGVSCVNLNGLAVAVGTTENAMIDEMQSSPLPWDQCDGSLLIMYRVTIDLGPIIYQTIQRSGGVPFTVGVFLPSSTDCASLYKTPDLTVQAAKILSQRASDLTKPGGNGNRQVLAQIQALGFSGLCNATMDAGYEVYEGGQLEGLPSDSGNIPFVESFLPYNMSSNNVCVSMVGSSQPESGTRQAIEDQCAQLYLGNSAQIQEAGVTNYNLGSTAVPKATDMQTLQTYCDTFVKLPITTVLPQIAVDFEAEKNFLLSTSEVKFHLDGVAANAASVLAIEAALATVGILVSRSIATLGLYRSRRLPSLLARWTAMLTAAVTITIFNIPNFALISRSLSNHGTKATFTQVSVSNYRPSNYSTVLRGEAHYFVTVEGSNATAVIGLLLYAGTLVLCLYLTWTEFSEIIHRREAAESRLGQDALLADKNLLVQWRGADSIVYDTLHPKKVVENAQAQELEYMRASLTHNAAASPRVPRTPPPRTPGDLYEDDYLGSRKAPDLYPNL